MESAIRICGLGIAVFLVLLAASSSHAAATKSITGKLNKPGYTVIALAANGKAKSVVAKQGRFRLLPRAKRMTLHLRAPDGVYAGPVVIRRQGRRAMLGVKAGARLGRIVIHQGYGRPARRLPRGWVDRTQTARARKGIPIGARVFGRVRSKPPRARVPGDSDGDGIPDRLDVDDDGDLILDNLDRSTAARAAQFATIFNPFSRLTVDLAQNVNANAAAATTDQINKTLSTFGDLLMGVLPGDSAELDCGGAIQQPPRPAGLIYCSRGGTGTFHGSRFPECCDADGDGLGTLTAEGVFGGTGIHHGARTDQIGTGDVLIERVTTSGVETEFTALLQYVFATAPALVSYSDGAGHSATVSYPVRGHPDPSRCPPDCSGPDQGIRGNGFPVAPRPVGDPAAGDVVLTLKFWRPQRSRIANDPQPGPGESGEWTDIGGLVYTAGITDIGTFCPQGAFSNPRSDPVPNLLGPATGPINRPGAGGFSDLATDKPATAANTLTYTLNVTRCLADKGLPAWNPGEERGLALSALGANTADEAQLTVFFKRE